jgi:V-type H+-transporting ATPase subunit H
MAPARNGSLQGQYSKNGNLPTIDNLREEDLSSLVDLLVDSKDMRREIWKEEMKQMSKVPEEGKNETKDLSTEGISPIQGLKSILVASTAPKTSASISSSSSSSSHASASGSSTPGAQSTSSRSKPYTEEVSVQMVYQAVFCFWLFSFDVEIAEQLNAKFAIIPLLADVARNAVKEKVVRMIVATLKNLAEKAPSATIPAMLGSKCLPLMESLSARKWSDEEITQDIDVVKELLSEKLKGMR